MKEKAKGVFGILTHPDVVESFKKYIDGIGTEEQWRDEIKKQKEKHLKKQEKNKKTSQ